MTEDGSRVGFFLGYVGGAWNMAVMIALVVKIIFMAMDSIKAPQQPDYFSYFMYIGLMLYVGIIGVWIFASSFRMKFSYSLHKGAVVSIVLGIISLNPFAIFGGIFGIINEKEIDSIKNSEELQVNPSFGKIEPDEESVEEE